MNIGIVIPGFSSDDHDYALPVQANLARELARNNDVRILALRYPFRRDRYRAFGADVTALGVGPVRGLRRLALWREALHVLARLHRERPFDVLHAMWADETGLIAGWAGKRLGVPTVVSLLGGELTCLDDIGYGLQRGRFSRWIVGQALHGADRIVAPGDYAKARMIEAGYRIPAERIAIAPLGVDTRLFSPGARPANRPHLIHVGSLVPVKDQATLLRALARLPAEVRLSIVGEGPQREALHTLTRSLGLNTRVEFAGAVAHLELPALYWRAALHVLSSRSEALPIAALEAAACGLHTISTAVGALPDYPAIATCVPTGDDAALAAAVEHGLNTPGLGSIARAAVLADFSIEAAADRLRRLYQTLIEPARQQADQ